MQRRHRLIVSAESLGDLSTSSWNYSLRKTTQANKKGRIAPALSEFG